MLKRVFGRVPVIYVEVVVGDHGLLVQFDSVRSERQQMLDGNAVVRSGDALVEEGGLSS